MSGHIRLWTAAGFYLLTIGFLSFSQQLINYSTQLSAAYQQATQQQLMQLQSQLSQSNTENLDLWNQYQQLASQSATWQADEFLQHRQLLTGLEQKLAQYANEPWVDDQLKSEVNQLKQLLIETKYQQLAEQVTKLNQQLDQQHQAYLASLTPTPQPIPTLDLTTPGSGVITGYSRISVPVNQRRSTADVIKLNLSQITVLTVSATGDNCDNNCPAQSLADYVTANQAFAGIHGTYFCPPDYASCQNKVNSYDFPVFDSNHKKWINAEKLFWNSRSMFTFRPGQASFCPQANSCDLTNLQGGIVNYPGLLHNGNLIVSADQLSANLASVRGTRGGIGTNGSQLFLVIARGVTVPELGQIMQHLGATNALNLDGGGSAALYYHGYKVGPGRALPNAIVIR